jgi:hypothetical protein
MIVVACKAELTEISPETIADILDPFHVGLVEATTTTEKGKNKMRMALAWTIQVSKLMGCKPRLSPLSTASGCAPATRRSQLLHQPCQHREYRELGKSHTPVNLMASRPSSERWRAHRPSSSLKMQMPRRPCRSNMKLHHTSHLKFLFFRGSPFYSHSHPSAHHRAPPCLFLLFIKPTTVLYFHSPRSHEFIPLLKLGVFGKFRQFFHI